jgi:hypothetical protein
MAITPLPPAPLPTDTQAQFNTKAFDLVAALDDFVTEANAQAVTVNADASTATTQAGIATTQAGIATTQAGIATTKAGEASQSADTAVQALESLQDFTDRYQGAKSTPPTLRNDGSALEAGDLYFDTVANEMRVYDGTAWKAAGSAVNGTSARQTYIATAAQTTFAITYDIGFVDVYLNGIKQLVGTDFTATSGVDIVFAAGLAENDVVDIIAFGAFLVANTYTQAQTNALLDDKADKVTPTITGLREVRVAVSASNIDLAAGNYFTKTISATTTFTVSNVAVSESVSTFVLELTNGGSATVNWFSGVQWPAGEAPTLTDTGKDVLAFFTYDAGTTWRGFVLGLDVQ